MVAAIVVGIVLLFVHGVVDSDAEDKYVVGKDDNCVSEDTDDNDADSDVGDKIKDGDGLTNWSKILPSLREEEVAKDIDCKRTIGALIT